MAGLIPQAFLDELLCKTSLVDLIDGYVPLKQRGNSFLACCPFHQEKSPSFNVSDKKQFYHCFGCGASGNAISFVMDYLNQNFTEAVETLANRLGLSVPREGKTTRAKTAPDHRKLLAAVSQQYQKQLQQGTTAQNYLDSRGLNQEVIARFQLGFAPEGWHQLEKAFPAHKKGLIDTGMLIRNEEGKVYDRYRNRIMFPIQDRLGHFIGFGGRVLDDSKPKYLNSPETALFQKNKELYGLYNVLSKTPKPEYILVVEGYMDVIALAQQGLDKVVATLGTSTSPFHMQLLAKYTNRVIFCFDGDEAGRQAAWKALESSLSHLNTGLDLRFMFLPEGQDPDSLVRTEGKSAFLGKMAEALPLHSLFFNTLCKDVSLQTPSGKTKLILSVKPYIQKMGEGAYTQLLLQELARLTHMENLEIQQLIKVDTVIPELTQLTRSPLHIAMALLLQHPEIYSQSQATIAPEQLHAREHGLLLQLLQLLMQNPLLSTAALLEPWRETTDFAFLNQLAAWDTQVPEAERVKEFSDTVRLLQKQNADAYIQQLIQKSRQQGLTDAEKIHLQNKLKERQIK